MYFDGSEQREASDAIVRRSFRIVAGGTPRDLTVTVETPQGDPGAVLTGIATADGDVIVVGRKHTLSMRRFLHGSVSGYCRGHSHCPVVVVPAPRGQGQPRKPRAPIDVLACAQPAAASMPYAGAWFTGSGSPSGP